MGETGRALVAIASSVLGLALVSAILSRNAATVGVINAAGNAFSNVIKAATSPITGGSTLGSIGTSYIDNSTWDLGK